MCDMMLFLLSLSPGMFFGSLHALSELDEHLIGRIDTNQTQARILSRQCTFLRPSFLNHQVVAREAHTTSLSAPPSAALGQTYRTGT